MKRKRGQLAVWMLALCATLIAASACVENPPPVARRQAPTDPAFRLGRPLSGVSLGTIDFSKEWARIPGSITACIRPEFRTRQWNVKTRGFRIELGPRAALNFERLAKAAFEDVAIDFQDQCGRVASTPWLDAQIVSVNRERPGEVEDNLQYSAIRLETALHQANGDEIWRYASDAVVSSAPPRTTPGFFGTVTSIVLDQKVNPHRDHAARDFGDALEVALNDVYEALMTSEEVRAAFEPPSETIATGSP